MSPNPRHDAMLHTTNVLVVLSELQEGQAVPADFHGTVVTRWDLAADRVDLSGKTVYLCGDLAEVSRFEAALRCADRGFVVADLSQGRMPVDDLWASCTPIDRGQLPLSVHGVGVLFRRFFDPDVDHFAQICAEHTFQNLTESTKPGRAHRTGIYLTPVEQQGEDLHFRLLRCSTNLSGPTENFRAHDTHIVDRLNQVADRHFEGHAPLNHVLAQVYHNTPATEGSKQKKATIKAHADKTKDMPANGIMAFCTFYDGMDAFAPMPDDPFDRGHGKASALTRLVFRLKKPLRQKAGSELPEQFTVPLYPNSVFFMPLSTNRWYVHEIRPSGLDAARLPTRLGYVVRCSNAEAVHRDGQTYLQVGSELQPLELPTPEGMRELRACYAEENRTDGVVDYANRFPFSMNQGDYLPPAL